MIYAVQYGVSNSALTSGKRYKVLAEEATNLFRIIDDEGDDITCRWRDCAFLNGGSWERIETECKPRFRQATLAGAKLWQDAEGTIPCTEGDPVGRVGEPPAWDGVGDKPPVGSRCMKGYAEVLVVAHVNVGSLYDPAVVYQTINDPMGIDWAVSNVFSPIRSEEDRAVEAMAEALEWKVDNHCRDRVARVYRAIRDGKVPGVKLEDSND